LKGVHTQYKALLPQEITATVGVRIGLRSVNITLLGVCVPSGFGCAYGAV